MRPLIGAALLALAAWGLPILLGTVERASACGCVAPVEETAFEDATTVFEGTAVARFDQASKRITVFEVHRVWKGAPRLVALVWGKFSDTNVATSCDVGLGVGLTYHVYAHRQDGGPLPDDPPGLLRAGYCGTEDKRSALALPEAAGEGFPMDAVRAAFAVFGFAR